MFAGGIELILILVLVAIFFGAGKLPALMEGVGKGAKAFADGEREGAEDEEEGTKG